MQYFLKVQKNQFQNAYYLKPRTTKQFKHRIHSIKIIFLSTLSFKNTLQFTTYAFQNVFQYYLFKLYNLLIFFLLYLHLYKYNDKSF